MKHIPNDRTEWTQSDECWLISMIRMGSEPDTSPKTSKEIPIAENDPDRSWIERMLKLAE